MKLLEIIAVRASGHYKEQARQYLIQFCRTFKEPTLSELKLYINSAFSGDIAVMLLWQKLEFAGTKTDVGQSLSSALKSCGLVDHTCWIMIEDQCIAK
ncbi:MAG: hypothetical protein KKA35_08945 [Proteobacteria bacterium]|nr:hypothetical protein [Pseudomonadota bacterium]